MSARLLVAGIVAGVIVSSPCFAQDKASQKFLKEAIEGNLAEVQMGQLAEKNGKSDGVRSFGQMLQKDHSEANQMGMSPPGDPNSKQKAMYDKMSKFSGDRFDREFGMEGVRATFAANAQSPLPQLEEALLTASRSHGTQLDDQSLILIRVL